MNNELSEEEKVVYTDEQCDIDVKRLSRALSDKSRIIIIKSVTNNFKINYIQAIRFLQELIEWESKVNTALFLSFKIPEGEREKYCEEVLSNEVICQYKEDREKLEMLLDFKAEEKPPEQPKGPKVNGAEQEDDPNYVMKEI